MLAWKLYRKVSFYIFHKQYKIIKSFLYILTINFLIQITPTLLIPR